MVAQDLVTKSFLKKELQKELKKSEDRIVERIIGEFKKSEEEDAVHQYSHSRINEELQDHEDRIRKLEQPSA